MNSDFMIYPAIDLREGQVVRLVQGDPRRQTVYETDPAAAAQRWINQGACWLHVVNLDGALDMEKDGEAGAPNRIALAAVVKTAQTAGVQVQFGGGVRTLPAIEQVLALGVQRVLLGTAAVEDPALAAAAVRRFGQESIGAALDARDGIIQTRGWQQSGGISALDLVSRLAQDGVRTVIYTDIARDGLAVGVNVAACQALLKTNEALRIIASGGVHRLDDIRASRRAGLAGIIVGRALYQGDFTLEEALAC